MHIAQYYRYSNSGVGVQEIIEAQNAYTTSPSRAMVSPIPFSPIHSRSTHSFQAMDDISPSRVGVKAKSLRYHVLVEELHRPILVLFLLSSIMNVIVMLCLVHMQTSISHQPNDNEGGTYLNTWDDLNTTPTRFPEIRTDERTFTSSAFTLCEVPTSEARVVRFREWCRR
jgi:hypothetical protein